MKRPILFSFLLIVLFGAPALAQITQPLQSPVQDMTPPSGSVPSSSAFGTQPGPNPNPIQDIWSGLGTALNATCNFFNGQPLQLNLNGIPVTIPIIGRWTPELAWICDAAKTWGIINGIVNQDWAQFAAEVAGQWIGDFVSVIATSIGIEMGSAAWANQIADFNDKLRRSYAQFDAAIRNAIWNAAQSSLAQARAAKNASVNQRLLPSQVNNPTAQKIEDITKRAESAVPSKTLAVVSTLETGVAEKRKTAAVTGIHRSGEALTSVTGDKGTLKSLMNKESAYMGIRDPVTGQYIIDPTTGRPIRGLIGETLSEASQAPDTRTAVEVLTKMVGHVAAVELYGSRAIVETVAALVMQLDATNHMLAQMILAEGANAVKAEREVRQALRDQSAEVVLEVFTAEAAGEGVLKLNELVFQQSGSPRTDY